MKKNEKLYRQLVPESIFYLDETRSDLQAGRYYYAMRPEKGRGYYWVYTHKDLFVVEKQDFVFHEDFLWNMPSPDYIAVQYLFSVSGEKQNPLRALSSRSLRYFIGGGEEGICEIYDAKIPVRTISIGVLPAFYQSYIGENFDRAQFDPRDALQEVMQEDDSPALVSLLKQIDSYSGVGAAAQLFYGGKVLEALALILEAAQRERKPRRHVALTAEDAKNLRTAAAFIDESRGSHFYTEDLCKIACMGNTTLRTKFKAYFGCNISEYTIRKRMEWAQELLRDSACSIAEVSRIVGYDRPESFSAQFHRVMGVLPREYRKQFETH